MAWTAPRTWTAGELVTAAMMNTNVRDNWKVAFTSQVFANSTWDCSIKTTGSTGPGGLTVGGDYVRTGPLVNAWGTVVFTSNSTNTGGSGADYYVVPPKNIASYLPHSLNIPVGEGFYYDKSANDTYLLTAVTYTSVKVQFRWNCAGTTEQALVNSTNPVAMSTADRFCFHLTYPTTTT